MEADKSQTLLTPLKWVHRILAIAAVGLAALLKAPKAHASNLLLQAISHVEEHGYWLIPLLLVLVPFVEWLRRRIESRSIWRVVDTALEELRDRIFPASADPSHHHRVTLFKRKGLAWVFRLWPWSGWMIPVARSCHTTRNSKACFMAPDDADSAEGFAGMAWTTSGMLTQERLPNLGESPTDKQVADYAKKGFVSPEFVRKKLPKAQSLCAFPVRVKGKNWGTIVIDSRSPTLDKDKINEHYKTVASVLSKLLESVK